MSNTRFHRGRTIAKSDCRVVWKVLRFVISPSLCGVVNTGLTLSGEFSVYTANSFCHCSGSQWDWRSRTMSVLQRLLDSICMSAYIMCTISGDSTDSSERDISQTPLAWIVCYISFIFRGLGFYPKRRTKRRFVEGDDNINVHFISCFG